MSPCFVIDKVNLSIFYEALKKFENTMPQQYLFEQDITEKENRSMDGEIEKCAQKLEKLNLTSSEAEKLIKLYKAEMAAYKGKCTIFVAMFLMFCKSSKIRSDTIMTKAGVIFNTFRNPLCKLAFMYFKFTSTPHPSISTCISEAIGMPYIINM